MELTQITALELRKYFAKNYSYIGHSLSDKNLSDFIATNSDNKTIGENGRPIIRLHFSKRSC